MAKKKGKNHSVKKQAVEEPSAAVNTEPSTIEIQQTDQSIVESVGQDDASGPQLTSEADKKKVEEVTTEVDTKNVQFLQLQEQINELQSKLLEKDSVIQQLTEEKSKVPPQNSETNEEVESLKSQLQQKVEESEKHKENYDKLLSRVSQMKTIFQKMKESEAKLEEVEDEKLELKKELDKASEKIKLLETTTTQLNSEILNLNSECTKLTEKNSALQKQIETEEFEMQNDSKRLEDENRQLKKELREAKSDLEEYQILVQEEKASKVNLSQEINDLKSKYDFLEHYKKISDEKCEKLSAEIERLNKTISDMKDDKEKVVSDVKAQLESKVDQLNKHTEEINDLKKLLKEKDLKLEGMAELENSLKEKQLLIGKLRHETITLNEHLNKAMKLVKRESGKETVDRELISNLFISFLQIPRGDNKKFEVLQLLANFLDWDDEKKRHAGLLSSGNYKSKSNSVVEVPTPGLHTSSSQSFVSLWTEFLEKESTPSGPTSK